MDIFARMVLAVSAIDDIKPKPVPGLRDLFANIAGMLLGFVPIAGVIGFLTGLFLWGMPFGDKADKVGKKFVWAGLVVAMVGSFFNEVLGLGENIIGTILS